MTYDVVVIGAGCEGLACAALAAEAGQRVVVLERSAAIGGLAAPREFAPNYRVPGLLHELGTPDPRLDAIDLGRHGLQVRSSAPSVYVPEADGPGLVFDRSPTSLASELGGRATNDPASYRELCGFLERIGPALRRLVLGAAPDLTSTDLRQLAPLLRQGFDLRRLGKRDMTELLRFAPMPATDWVGEHLTDELARVALIAPALMGSRNGPRAPHGALFTALAHVLAHPGWRGGPAAVARALAAAATQRGATVRTEAEVRSIRIEGARAIGVELSGGEQLAAKHVVAACDPRTTLTQLLPARSVPRSVRHDAQTWRARGEVAKLHVALSGPLEFGQRQGQRFEAALIADGLDGLERAADASKYDELPARPALELRVPSLDDPSLAPEGHSVVSIAIRTAPRDLRGGWTEAARTELTERTLALLEEHASGLRASVVATELVTPADIEADTGSFGGHLFHGEIGLDQLLSLRPGAELSRGRTPIEGLLLASRGIHPGPFLLGGPGAQAAAALTR